MTVLCGTIASYYRKIPAFHVEAGLRSYDIYEPFPEEVMRQMTSRVAELNFAPTEKNKQALLRENISPDKIFVTGNTVIDALFCLSEDIMEKSAEYFLSTDIKIDVADKKNLEKLLELGGMQQVPFLEDTENNITMYESEDIIAYIKNLHK